jgi:hypothetical protein
MQMFLRLHMSFLMDSKLDFSYEYLFACYLIHPCQEYVLLYLVGLIHRS